MSGYGSMKLAIYHNVIAPYKVPFFEAICDQWPGEVTLFTSSNLRNSRQEWGEQTISANNLSITRLPAIRGPGIGWYNPTIFPRLLRANFDILLTGDYHFLSSVLATWAARVQKKPVALYTVATKRSVVCSPTKSWFHKYLNTFMQYGTGRAPIIYRTLRSYDCYITPSDKSVNHLTDCGVSRENMSKIYNPVDTDKFSPRSAEEQSPLTSLTKEVPTLCYVGRLVPEKGLNHLIEAIKLTESNPNLRIVGDGPIRNDLESKVDECGLQEDIEFLGRVPHDEIPSIHDTADAFVLPSVPTENNVEQFPNALLEGMSSGLPAITFDIAGGIEEIHTNGHTGVKANSITSTSLAKAIDDLFDMDCENLGKNARNRIMNDYSPESIGRQYVSELTRTIEEYDQESKM